MIILGIDPGMATTGYAVVHLHSMDMRFNPGTENNVLDYGVISTKPSQGNGDRLQEIYEGVRELIDKYQPQVMAVESLFFYNNQKTAMMVGQARGVVLLAGNQAGLEIYDYTPKQVKQAVVGYGVAKKNQVQFMVKNIFCLEDIPRPDDAADALAVCYCHGMQIGARSSVPVQNN
ncbi:MAG: crossover junction endodeoxyribonuclease RuvC [Patescibacteria group bacterium]